MVRYTPIGEMTEELELLRATRTKDTTGQETLTWSKIETLMGRVMPFSGREYLMSLQVQSDISYKINFPYYPNIEADQRILVPSDWTTLSGGIDAAVTAIPVADYSLFTLKSTDFYIKIDSEIMRVTAGQGTATLTATRGQLGTTPASHSSDAYVSNMGMLEIKYVQNVNYARVETELLCSEVGSIHA